jgi:hypothetical protein
MYVLLIIITIIIIIFFIICSKYNGYTGMYCNKYDICIQIDDKNVVEFELIKSKLFDFYLKLADILPIDDPRTIRLRKNFQIDNMFEVYPHNNEGDTSYSINKGEQVGVCVRSGKDFYNIHDINVIKFVFIHELAHVITVSQQHSEEFWRNFKYLLNNCYINNLLKKVNYSIYPEEYCGLSISYSPYFDENIKNYNI